MCVLSLVFAVPGESSAIIGTCALPEDVLVNGKTVLAGTYAIQIQYDSGFLQLLKGDEVLASERAIVLPARGEDEITTTIVKTAKREYVRIRVRNDNTWFIVYLPSLQHSAISTQRS